MSRKARGRSTSLAWLIAWMLVGWMGVGVSAAAPASSSSKNAPTLMVAAGDFQFAGGWVRTKASDGTPMLWVRSSSKGQEVADAKTVIDVPAGGMYTIWTRSRSYETSPHDRRYQLLIDGQAVDKESGDTGTVGWQWEQVGRRSLTAGKHVLALHDVTHFYARCSAILLTRENLDPDQVEFDALKRYRVKPVQVKPEPLHQTHRSSAAVQASPPDQRVAELKGDGVRIVFYQSRDKAGDPVIRRETQLRIGDRDAALPLSATGEKLVVLYAPKPNINTASYFPSWSSDYNRMGFVVNGKRYEVAGEPRNPFLAGKPEVLVPRAVKAVTDEAVTLSYESADGLKALGRWELASDRLDAKLTVSFDAPRSGCYSLAFEAFDGWARDQVKAVQLPPVFQDQRVPDRPELAPSALMPHPLAIVETSGSEAKQAVSYAVVADPDRLPFEWPNSHNSRYGFSLLNEAGKVQPVALAPVLGLDGSQHKAGERVSMSWRVLAMPGRWSDALTYASKHVMGVTDYRRPYKSSLTDAALRMIDLMKDPVYSGWDPHLKGFYNIEGPGMVKQSSPLMVMATAFLTRSEKFYESRALPTLEYVLSRESSTFAASLPREGVVKNKNVTQLHVPVENYSTALWQGVDEMLGGLNGWVAQMAFDQGKIRYRGGPYPRFADALAAHRMKPQAFPLSDVMQMADRYIQTHVDGRDTRALGIKPHYNVSFYAHWWDLLDLYDVTGQKRYLDAAQRAGFQTIAGMWATPPIPKGSVLIQPEGSFPGASNPLLIWYGWDKLQVGYPRRPNDTPAHRVPAWLVSQVGRGFEQPTTSFTPGGNVKLVTVTSAAGHLLRLADRTGRDIFKTYARDSIIGRFANYPGYYINGYTDLFHDPAYPYEGPDVTRFYFHHIPVYLAFTMDFLVAEMENRSDHQIKMPWVEQLGYAQFTNRIYGARPGKFYGDHEASLWLNRDLVSLDSVDVDYLTARGKDRFWIVLMNQTHEPVKVNVRVNAPLAGTTPGGSWFKYGSRPTAVKVNTPLNQAPVEVPADGLVTIALPAKPQPAKPKLPALKGGHVVKSLPEPWGDLHAFRIRSPFGKDALYVVATGHPKPGAVAWIDTPGSQWERKRAGQFPYEFTVYPWPMNEDMRFTFKGIGADGKVVQTDEIVLKGGD